MNINEAKNKLYEICANYFGDDHVFFAQSKMAKAVDPYVTLYVRGNSRQTFANKAMDGNTEKTCREITLHVDVNLYTKGTKVSGRGGFLPYSDTSLSSMNQFLEYLDSDNVIEELSGDFCSISIDGEAQSMAELQRESQYSYRAMVQLNFSFVDVSFGYSGINGVIIPDDANGGNEDLVEDFGTIKSVDIKFNLDDNIGDTNVET